MTGWNIASICIIVAAFLVALGVRIYNYRKHNSNVKIDFINVYGDNIIKLMQDIISILQVNINDFDNTEDYEKEIIRMTIDKLKHNASEYGIDYVNLFSTKVLTEIVYDILNQNLVDVFSVLKYDDIKNSQSIYPIEVVKAITDEALNSTSTNEEEDADNGETAIDAVGGGNYNI